MKRGSGLRRRTPLPRGTAALKRSAPLTAKHSDAPSRKGRGRHAASGELKPLNDFPPKVRALVRHRSGLICEACGAERAVIHHHRRPRRREGWRPGTNVASNALHIGLVCDEWIERQNRAGALEVGQLLTAEQDPAAVPVAYRGRWVLLDDLGHVHPWRAG